MLTEQGKAYAKTLPSTVLRQQTKADTSGITELARHERLWQAFETRRERRRDKQPKRSTRRSRRNEECGHQCAQRQGGTMDILGIDIGGSGIKAAPVDLASGTLLAERYRLDTPSPATPAAISETVAQLVDHFHWQGAIGCGMPAVVCHGYVMTAANIARTWIGQNAQSLFENATGCAVTVINDADAAGYAEMRFGAGRDVPGTVLLVTLGTGIGTALFICLISWAWS